MPKYLFTFEKGESVRWLGHLDILRTFERAIRRAGLPIAFSGGFNPRERIAFASALSVGITGANERATIELTEPVSVEEFAERLNAALPPGIRVNLCVPLEGADERDQINAFDRAEFTVTCRCPLDTELNSIVIAIDALFDRPTIEVTREREKRTKVVDIRPLIHEIRITGDPINDGRLALSMTIAQGDGGSVKPSEVITALAELVPGLTLRRAQRERMLPEIDIPAPVRAG